MTKQELASKIWSTANELRSKIKSNEYKDYIIGFMFYKYLSDKVEMFMSDMKEPLESLDDKDVQSEIKASLGYVILKDYLFNSLKAKGNKLCAADVKDALDSFRANVASTSVKVFDNIFDTLESGLNKLGDTSGSRDKAIRTLITTIGEIPTTNTSYDVLGYIYEFLIYKFSTAAADDGAFYTPHEVSSLLSRLIAYYLKDKNKDTISIYDPTSGSGSLLLNIGKEASHYIHPSKIFYYGQEKITETYHLTRMNLVMKGVPIQNISIRNGDTLEDDWPYFDKGYDVDYELLPMDAVVSNPPYSLRWDITGKENDPRFNYGLAPNSKADFAFLQHCLYHLKKDGIMGIVLPHGVLFRGASEGEIRKNLIENNHIETIIGLPSNLFFATSIPTVVMLLRKDRTTDDVLFVDASTYYDKSKTQNVLRESDIRRIFDAVIERKDIKNFARVVSKEEIISNDYNLNIPRYVSATDVSSSTDLYSLMTGKISNKELDKYSEMWAKLPTLRGELFGADEEFNEYSVCKVKNIKDVVYANADVKAFIDNFTGELDDFKDYLTNVLLSDLTHLDTNVKLELVDKLFELSDKEPLLDKYAIYEAFMGKYADIELDIERIMNDGLNVCKQVETIMVNKKVKGVTTTVPKGYTGTIFSLDLIKEQFYTEDFDEINEIKAKIDGVVSEYTSLIDELDEDIKASCLKDDGETFDINKAKKIEECKAIVSLMNKEKALNKEIKEIETTLNVKAKEKIESLTDAEVIDLLSKKWVLAIIDSLKRVNTSTIDSFINELNALVSKYQGTLNDIEEEISTVASEFKDLMNGLKGSDVDLQALEILKGVL